MSEKKTQVQLQLAYDLLKSGKRNEARPILINILRENEDVEEAWFMLSVCVADPAKQKKALEQVLRINPQNEKAKQRLGQAIQDSLEAQAGVKKEKSSAALTGGDANDLLNQRLFSAVAPEIDEHSEKLDEIPSLESLQANRQSPKDKKRSKKGTPPSSFNDSYDNQSFDDPEELEGKVKKKIKPLYFVLGGGLVIILLCVASVSVLKNVLLGGGLGNATPPFTETTSVRQFPPTYTPSPSPVPTNTSLPTNTPLPTATNSPVPLDNELSQQVSEISGTASQTRKILLESEPVTSMGANTDLETDVTNAYLLNLDENYYASDLDLFIALELMTDDQSLTNSLMNCYVDPTGSAYFPDKNQINLVRGLNGFSGVQQLSFIRQYGLALIDELFDLSLMGYTNPCSFSNEADLAMRALIHGDSVNLGEQWQSAVTAEGIKTELENYQSPTVFTFDSSMPDFLFEYYQFPYVQGTNFVAALFEKGGWESVNQAYAIPPVNTSQVMHPEKYIKYTEAVPVVDPNIPDLLDPGWTVSKEGSLGEWMTYATLRYPDSNTFAISEEDALAAAEGWMGDHYQLALNSEQDSSVLLVHWVWSTAEDASEFAETFNDRLTSQFGSPALSFDTGACWDTDTEMTCILTLGNETLWMKAPDEASVNSLKSGYSGF
ncbi:MAG: hypothetical protein JXA19_00350 [Anaerolineales bacterium]|nr:hypothetical protein [Anaerolineales bacterium]